MNIQNRRSLGYPQTTWELLRTLLKMSCVADPVIHGSVVVVFFTGGENRSAPEKNLSEKGENQHQTQPTRGIPVPNVCSVFPQNCLKLRLSQ